MSRTPRVRDEVGLGYGAVLVVVLLWGIGPLFVRAIDSSALTIATIRNWITVPVMLTVAALARSPLTWRWFKAAVPGGLLFAVAQTLGFASFQETSLAIAAIISALSPLLIVIVAVPLFGERLTPRQILLMALSFSGVLAVVFGGGGGEGATVFGDLLAVGSLFAMTGYLLAMKHARLNDVPAAAYVAGVFLVCAVVVTPIDIVWGDAISTVNGIEWLWVTLLALLAGCTGHVLMTWAQKHVNVSVASVMVLGTTVVTSIGGWIFFDQALSAVQIAGGLLVLMGLSGVLLVQLSDSRTPEEVPVLVELAEPPLAE
ncbi:MAG TPA: DMT family transporter [Acidimicrobiia bacterium]